MPFLNAGIDITKPHTTFTKAIRPSRPQDITTMDTLIQEKADAAYRALVAKYKTNDVDYLDGEDYVCIESPDQFLSDISNNLSGNYLIMNDLDFGGKSIAGFGSFSGVLKGRVLNGKNPTLKNFAISSVNQKNLGLFSSLEKEGTISNIDIDTCTVSYKYDNKEAEGACAAMVGRSFGTIENCTVKNAAIDGYLYKNIGTNSSAKLHCGAIIGWVSSGKVTKCSAINNSITGYSNGGKTDGTVELNIGGIAGMVVGSSLIDSCLSDGNTINETLKGGKTWTFTHAQMNGRAGGIVGYCGVDATMINCTAQSKDKSNYSFTLKKAESCEYDNNTKKGDIFGKSDGNVSGSVVK